MFVAISAVENHIASAVDPHFGRCAWFCLLDSIQGTWEFIENPFQHDPGHAGCDAADFLADKGVFMVIAGRFGSMVVERFRELGIQMVIPEPGTYIQRIMQQLNQNER
jgi:predicted Fe-Mo cluster-binding NifX family protein